MLIDDTQDRSPGATGSTERLLILMYLASRPAGAGKAELARVAGLDEETVLYVLRRMREAGRLAMERAPRESSEVWLWFTPSARAHQRPSWVVPASAPVDAD